MPGEPNPPVRRMKTYTGQTGFVYQYYFVGKREALADDPEAPAVEYVFDVTSDRKLTFAVSVFLKPEAVATWSTAHGRPLTDPEQYAAAKLCLLAAFDEIDDMLESGRRLRLDAPDLEALLQQLELD